MAPSSTSVSRYDPAPVTKHFEFMGPPGALGITLATTFFAYFFAIGCSEHGCPPMPLGAFMSHGLYKYTTLQGWLSLWDGRAAVLYTAWYAYTVICWLVLPGQWVSGITLRNGETLQYKINAFATMLLTVAIMLTLAATKGVQPFVFVFDHWVGLVTASLVNAFAQAFFVFAKSYTPGAMLAEGGNSRSHLYNWFIGRELNPRIGLFDIKSFNELRPGMVLWFIVIVSSACKQYDTFGHVTASMWLVVGFESLYIFDALFNESAILTTMDITTDGFGFMLSTGDLVWVPWTYSLQARYLALHPNTLGATGVLAVLAVHCIGYYIFRVSNLEKNDFRQGRNPKDLSFMQTKRGTKLLTSGWWGRSRHPNYMGDWIMGWSWCLPTGFNTPLTYYYVVYFAILLVHRQQRDDEACRRKYGDDWTEYCKRVRSRILPGLY